MLVLLGGFGVGECPGQEYYGIPVDAHVTVWCLDRSGSMNWLPGVYEIDEETVATLNQMSALDIFSPVPLPATPANVAAAEQWLETSFTGSTCLIAALEEAVNIAETYSILSDAEIFLVTDFGENCLAPPPIIAPLLTQLQSVNPSPVPVNVVAFGGGTVAGDYATWSGGELTEAYPYFIRGDANSDGVVGLSDAVFVLQWAYVPGSPAPLCEDAADFDDDGDINGAIDAIQILQWIFVPGPYPTFANCGPDAVADTLSCPASLCP